MPRIVVPVAFVFLVLLAPEFTNAGGILHVFPPELNGRPLAVARPSILLSRSLVTVSDTSLEYRIDQTFYNDNDFSLEGTYLLPVQDFDFTIAPRLSVDGTTVRGEILTWEKFLPILQNLTTRMRDPSLLGLAGRRMFVVHRVVIPAKTQQTFSITYTGARSGEGKTVDISLPLDGEIYSVGPVGELEIRVRMKMSTPIRSIFSPTHHLSVYRESPVRCIVTTRVLRKPIRTHYRFIAALSRSGTEVDFFTHREAGEKGAFMALVSPPPDPPGEAPSNKNVLFLTDVSGSMKGLQERIAKRAVTFGLERLQKGDRFNVILVGTRVRKLAEDLLPATRANIRRAVEFLNSAAPVGGTDLYNGLIEALEQFRSRRRPNVVVLVSDGQGTVGITDPEKIIREVKRHNMFRARFFSLAVGKKPEAAILEKVAAATRGEAWHFAGDTDIHAFLSRFFKGVSLPRLRNISLKFRGMKVQEMEPDPIPDLFGRQELVILGRYMVNSTTRGELQFSAKKRKGVERVVKEVSFPVLDRRNPFIPQLWAMRRLAAMLEREWLKGGTERDRRLIRRLARKYGFMVPAPLEKAPTDRSSEGGGRRAASLYWKLKKSHVVGDVRSEDCRFAAGKVFRRVNGRWVDTRYRAYMPTVNVDFLGRGYFSLLRQDPDMGACLAVAPKVTFLWGSTAVAITPGKGFSFDRAAGR